MLMLIWLFICLNPPTFAQTSPEIITLGRDPSTIIRANKFFIQDVEDQRKLKGSNLGKIIFLGKEKPVSLNASVEKELASYWSHTVPRIGGNLLPLYIRVKAFELNERRLGPNRVAGDIKLDISFHWYRNMASIDLTNYQTSATYTRPEKEFDHQKLIRQMLDQSLVHFQKWMHSNAGKTPALARNLKIIFTEKVATDKADTVFYHIDRPLVWNDFQGQKNRTGSRYAAAVFTSFAYEGRSYPKEDDLILEINLQIFMVKSMSWVLSEAKNAGTLRHEQLHFDITRIVVERFKEKLESAELTIEDYDSEIQYQFLESFREMNTEQENYDRATGHGLNNAAQAEWEKKISKEIAAIYSRQ